MCVENDPLSSKSRISGFISVDDGPSFQGKVMYNIPSVANQIGLGRGPQKDKNIDSKLVAGWRVALM